VKFGSSEGRRNTERVKSTGEIQKRRLKSDKEKNEALLVTQRVRKRKGKKRFIGQKRGVNQVQRDSTEEVRD